MKGAGRRTDIPHHTKMMVSKPKQFLIFFISAIFNLFVSLLGEERDVALW